ncbi:aspartate aminotransferase family protein [Rhizobiaceae bacterium]|nr:aspartate aminotransferase family protein [Rhizobiaceae bacterium]
MSNLPMADHPTATEPHSAHLYTAFGRSPLRFVRGEGVSLFAEDGTEYLDFAAGIAVNSLGHGHPHLVETLRAQAGELWHSSNLYQSPHQDRLAERLCANSFADRVFFTNSGSESLECAFKTVRRYHHDNGAPERVDIITFEGAFHGRTLAAITAGGNAKYMTGFGPPVPGFINLPFGDHEALKAAVGPTTAAICIEPIQGEGGIRDVPHQCLRGLRAMCDEHGILLIYDEVQCGVGRTGKMFAYEWSGAEPDVMAIAKGIGGGFPVGACLATEKVASAMTPGTHGTTYGGNPLAMAVANAVLDVMLADGFLESVRERGRTMAQKLAQIADTYPDLIEDARGEGLIQGLKCRVSNLDLVAALREERLLTVPAGDNVVRVLPPLTITDAHVNDAFDRIDRALSKMSASAQAAE